MNNFPHPKRGKSLNLVLSLEFISQNWPYYPTPHIVGVVLPEGVCPTLIKGKMYHGTRKALKKVSEQGLNLGSLKPIQREFKPHEQDQGISAWGIGIRIEDVLHIRLDGDFR